MADLKKQLLSQINTMIANDTNLRKAQFEYERMARLDWKPPAPLGSFAWIRGAASTSPYDALRGAVRAMSNLRPLIKVHPATVLKAGGEKNDRSREAREMANRWETVFRWHLDHLEKRSSTFLSDIIWSSCLYHEINGQIIHLPTQKKIGGLGGMRGDAAFRIGDFAGKLADPKTVHVRYSPYGVEADLGVTVRTAKQLADFWDVREIKAKIDRTPDYANELFVEFDFVDYDNRWVYCVEGNLESDFENVKYDLFGPEPWLGKKVPFLPWVNVAGGTRVDAAPEHQRRPLLYPVYQTGQWLNDNVMKTILMSVATAEAAAPRNILKGPGAEDVEVDYGEPGGRINLTQFQEYQRIQQLGLDPQLQAAEAALEAAMRRSTVAEVLVTGQPMGQEQPFAGFNLQVMQALASLGDFKRLGELFLSRWFENMLLTAHYTGSEISGYGENDDHYTIDGEDVDPEAIYIGVELSADVPVDRVQRVTAAMNLANSENLPVDPHYLLEFLGITDPESAIRMWKRHQFDLADLRGRLKRIEITTSGELEQMAAQMAQGMIAEQMQEAQAGTPENMGGPPGIEGVGGPGFDPSQGGMPPAMASPMGNTFENQRGTDRGGVPLA